MLRLLETEIEPFINLNNSCDIYNKDYINSILYPENGYLIRCFNIILIILYKKLFEH